ncbi:MAG: cyclase family protein [Bacillota bacterium]
MILYDISMTINREIAVYKNRAEKRPVFKVTSNFQNRSVYETRLDMDLHTGTHIDMPLHIYPDGAASEQWSKEEIFTRCVVLDFTANVDDAITAKHLEQELQDAGITGSFFDQRRAVLLKTKNSLQDAFDFNFTYLDKSGASYLAEKNIRGVGIDALGIERNQPDHETHKLLLKAGIWIIEGLRLQIVPPGEYILVTMPLKIEGVEAMPARSVLLAPNSMPLP